jgi:uncharacterized protein YjbI with pentapeptide repeats
MTTPHEPISRIFLSFSHADSEFAQRLGMDLRQALGEDDAVWLDVSSGLHGGDTWWRTIVQELTNRPIFIVILSPDAMKSSWLQDEVDLAWMRKNSPEGKIIIPVLYRSTEVRADLRTLQFISFLPPTRYEDAFKELLHAIQLRTSHVEESQSAAFIKSTQGQGREESPLGSAERDLHDYWATRGQSWRTEQEIGAERQAFLTRCRETAVDAGRGVYPFLGVRLTRGDVEWLLGTHEDSRGPVDWSNEDERLRLGLDVRGADLRGTHLRGLPLARLLGGEALADVQRENLTARQLDLAGVHMEGADLREAHLEEAHLEGAHLQGTHLEQCVLWQAHLEGADVSEAYLASARLDNAHFETTLFNKAHLEGASLLNANLGGADLREAHLEAADLRRAHLEGAFLSGARLERANLREARLEGAALSEAGLAGGILSATHLEGADLSRAQFQGKRVEAEDLKRIQEWVKDFPPTLPPADLRWAFFDAATNFQRATLGDREFGHVTLAEVRWGGVNLSLIDWQPVTVLGDERAAWNWKPSTLEPLPDKLPRKLRVARARQNQQQQAVERLEVFRAAVGAYRQLATALRNQGLNEDADHFAYRAQVLQREVYRQKGERFRPVFSSFLDSLAGYGYKPERSIGWYVVTILGFAALYAWFAHLPAQEALVLSMTSFHGRGFPGSLSLRDPIMMVAAAEAIFGLLIEISFIATFTQRFFSR